MQNNSLGTYAVRPRGRGLTRPIRVDDLNTMRWNPSTSATWTARPFGGMIGVTPFGIFLRRVFYLLVRRMVRADKKGRALVCPGRTSACPLAEAGGPIAIRHQDSCLDHSRETEGRKSHWKVGLSGPIRQPISEA